MKAAPGKILPIAATLLAIGVTGCDKRESLVLICADQADACFAADSPG
jgi:hypothetical protein